MRYTLQYIIQLRYPRIYFIVRDIPRREKNKDTVLKPIHKTVYKEFIVFSWNS